MRFRASLFLALPLLATGLLGSPDAAACGGFFPPGENEDSQVSGHKMIFSISQTATTLWDQISYAGDPSSFAWVLPIQGTVTVGLSSDALFQNLDVETQVTVVQPTLDCPVPACDQDFGGGGAGLVTTTTSAPGDAGGVTVIAQAVVGPYQTVQLSSSDPTTLATWLSSNGYSIPADFAPTISAYVAAKFDFLALKLIPGMGVSAMKPVRVTTPGAGATLPLRMVAAGAPATTPITLWIFGEGRYQPTNFPTFTITGQDLVWDFGSSTSNYSALREAGFNLSNGKSWLLETSAPFSEFPLQSLLTDLALSQPLDSGYADSMGNGAQAALMADLAALWGNITANSLWVTRARGELPVTALGTDLILGASSDQTELPLQLLATQSINTPVCPTYPPCTGGSGGAGGLGGAGGAGGSAGTGSSGGCSVGSDGERSAGLGGLVLALALSMRRRRRA